ncbi:MAG: hypothetical protein ACFBSC_05675 [Microcoleaceae cyanobacterium]
MKLETDIQQGHIGQILDAREVLLRTLVIFLVWRCSFFLFGFFGLHLTVEFDFEKHLSDPSIINSGKEWQAITDNYFLDGFFRFDSFWYDTVITEGYSFDSEKYNNVAFFPLYPYLSKWLGYIIGNHYIAGWLISNLGLFFGLSYIYKIGLLFFDQKLVERSLILLLIFPSSIFLSSFYTEGLFLWMTTASFYYFLTNRYFWSGLFGMLAALTRFSGILLFISFLADILYRLWQGKQSLRSSMIWLLLIPVGIGIFMMVLYIQVGEPLAFIKAQSAWHRESTFPFWTFVKAVQKIDFTLPRHPTNTLAIFDLLSAIGFLTISLMMFRKKYPTSLWVYALLSVMLPLSTGRILSMARFCSVIFPAFFYLADLGRRPMVFNYLLFSFTFFFSIFSLRFMNWFWLL